MTDQSNEPVIRAAFERCLIDGLKGQPVIGKDGPVTDPETKEVLLSPPDASFLNVVRGYLKDLFDLKGKPKVPQTGQPRPGGLLDAFERGGKGLPFSRPQ